MNKKIVGTVVAIVFLVGCGAEQKDDTDSNEEVLSPSENAVTYNCAEEEVKVDFNNDVEPKTAELFFMAKNTKLILPNIEAASGAKYSDGDVVFWTHQGEATLAMEGSEQSLNCLEQSITNIDEIVDENGNTVTVGCRVWFDGCNTCQVGDPGMPMACTRKFCAPEVMEEARCLDDEQK